MEASKQYALVRIDAQHHRFRLDEGLTRCGRGHPECRVVLDNPSVSRLHAEIQVTGDTVEVHDLDSRNGTFVNGQRVAHQRLHVGDRITFGSVELQLHCNNEADGAGATRRAHQPRRRQTKQDGRPRFARVSELDWAEATWSNALVDGDHDALASFVRSAPRAPFAAALADLGRFLVTDHGEDHVPENCLRAVARLFDYRLACLLLLDPAGEPEVGCTLPPESEAQKLHVSRSLVDAVLRERRALLLQAAERSKLGDSARRAGISSALVVPLFDNNDVLGVIYLDQGTRGRAFSTRHLQLLQLLANLVAAKLLQARTRSEMVTAGYIERSMLCRNPQPPPGYEIAVRLEPSIQVGGDFYETLPLPDGRYLLAVGDVAGHGVGAALQMANILATLRALAPQAASPLALTRQLGDQLTGTMGPHGFATLFLGFLDPVHHTLEYVSAGHECPALFVPGLPAATVDSTGMPLGIPQPPIELGAATLAVPAGALLCAWSDGIPEALRRTARPPVEFSRERLLGELTSLRQEPTDEIVRRIFAQVDSFMESPHACDDRTLLVLRRNGV